MKRNSAAFFLFFSVISVASFSTVTVAFAMTGTTVEGYTACSSEGLLDEFIQFSQLGDYESMQSYLDSQECIVMGGGLHVTITQPTDIYATKTAFTFQGLKFWTIREGVDYHYDETFEEKPSLSANEKATSSDT